MGVRRELQSESMSFASVPRAPVGWKRMMNFPEQTSTPVSTQYLIKKGSKLKEQVLKGQGGGKIHFAQMWAFCFFSPI
jgi:hypothetical protein